MSVEFYGRYREALRRGHVAAAGDRLEESLAAYGEAIQLAPDRALPHVSAGSVLLRLGRPVDALAAFHAALARSPREEAGLRGRAESLARLGRRAEAAGALDLLSDVQERSGNLTTAVETAQAALGLAEQKARRRRLQDLIRRLRLSTPDRPVADVLDGVLPTLEFPEPAGLDSALPGDASQLTRSAGAAAATAGEVIDDDLAAIVAAAVASEALATHGAVPEPAVPTAPAQPAQFATRAEPLAEGTGLMSQAEAAIDAGDLVGAPRTLLASALAFEAQGLPSAALDACYIALEFAPDDAQIHLELVELYLQLGWDTAAADKLALLGRLTELDGLHGGIRARLIALAADHFPDDPRLRRLSA